MKLSKEEVQKIAKLARLELKTGEIDQMADDLSSILDYFKKLKEVNTDKIVPTFNISGLENVMRSDEVIEADDDTKKNLLTETPDKEDGLVKTKSVF